VTNFKWTRRELLKTGLAVSAGAAATKANSVSRIANSLASADPELEKPSPSGSQGALPQGSSLRERLLMDFGWRFHLGHASDPSRDFGLGAPSWDAAFAKTGGLPEVTQVKFDDSSWRAVDLPHDWAVELPFKNDPELPGHGGKPLGRAYPETSIGWYRKKQPTLGAETGSDFSTRGIYKNDPEKGYVSAYDVNFPDYTVSTEDWWKIYAEREFLAGGFNWTGFDYRGEPSPYKWPCISSHFGAMDTCGFPKDNYFYYQAWWTAKPVMHLFPHWNWEGKEGQEIAVWCHSNLDSVELFLNGGSLGSKKVNRNSHVEWNVRYAQGVLEARGSKDGQVARTEKRETTGAPAKVVLRADRLQIAADGEDVSVIAVEIVDAKGRTVPTASNEVTFRVEGPGRLIGVANGDPSCHEPDKPASFTEGKRSAFNGLCMAIAQALKQPGSIHIEASSPGLESSSVVIASNPAKLRPVV